MTGSPLGMLFNSTKTENSHLTIAELDVIFGFVNFGKMSCMNRYFCCRVILPS